MSDVAIRVEKLGKRYRRGLPAGNDRLSEVMVNATRRLMALPHRLAARFRPPTEPNAPTPDRAGEFWALKDVNFEVKRGEVVGVIGRNGAGKSTLLKVLSRITEPTAGRFGVAGRVASLLEVGTGFHGELTGRENVYLSGSLLGMTRAEVRRKFDAIAAFAEVDGFLDTPVKRYSSGMQMRLGFAVAAHLEPDILIVDEVLAVGDAAFQKKCLGKMQEVAGEGRTVIFVSHNIPSVQNLCSRAMLLVSGQVTADGTTQMVLDHYTPTSGQGGEWRFDPPNHVLPHVRSVTLRTPDGRPLEQPDTAAAFAVGIEFSLPRRTTGLILAIAIANRDGVYLFSSTPADCGRRLPEEPGVYRSAINFPPGLFLPRTFGVAVALYSADINYHLAEGWGFSVTASGGCADQLPTGRVGELSPPCEWEPFVAVPDTGGAR